MAKHLNDMPLLPNTKRAHAERIYARLDRLNVPEGTGRHRKPPVPDTCTAYTLAGFKVYYCRIKGTHETHVHPVYGAWTGKINDMDQYRKKLIRRW